MKIELHTETVEQLVREDLTTVLKSLRQDYKKRKAGQAIAVWHLDKDEDLAEFRRHIDAFQTVLKYY